MIKKNVKLIKDNSIVSGDCFTENDFHEMKIIFRQWIDINKRLKKLKGRALNVPDILSEGLYCYYFNAVRTNNTAFSYDAVDISTGEGIQVKSTSIINDLTSFGPTSTWDKLIFMDFCPNIEVDGIIDFYLIPDESLYDIILNKKKNETFRDQQIAGKRPRLSIKKEFVNKMGLKPLKRINLLED